jgi:GNAT superfamily N-acetyltransferase
MIRIDTQGAIHENRALLSDFEQLYHDAFPDVNERESFNDICARINQENQPLRSVIALTYSNEGLLGGMVLDIYENTWFHLIYLLVKPEARNQGIGKQLICEELPALVGSINSDCKGVFLESNIPWLTHTDSFDPYKRLSHFRHFGVKWIPIQYVQPPLSKEKEFVSNLFLLYYPFSKEYSLINKQYIRAFLYHFYVNLGAETDGCIKYESMLNELNHLEMNQSTISTQEIPIQERSAIQFNRVSLCVQVSHETPQKVKEVPCEQFHSYETDLLSYHFQRDRPITSRFLPEHSIEHIEIHFPPIYAYHSEGRTQHMANERTTIPANIKISQTHFHASENTVWSVTLMNCEDNYFSELEIIKLSSYFGSSQERTGLKDNIQFSKPGEEKRNLSDFIRSILNLTETSISIGSGIIQLDTAKILSKNNQIQLNWGAFYDELTESFSNPDSPNIALNTKYNEDESYTAFLNLMCGFALGIFDYNRMGFDEVVDTLQLLKGDNSYLLFINRGIMLNLCHEDEMFESVREHIGISPYLLIPNAALNNNTFYLESTLKKLSDLEFSDQSTHVLLEVRKQAEHALLKGVVNNIFHYKTEKNLFEFCSVERNHALIAKAIQGNLEELQQVVDERKTKREDQSDLFTTLLLTVLSCLQFQGIFQSIANDNFVMSWVYTATFSVTITFMIYTLLRMKK